MSTNDDEALAQAMHAAAAAFAPSPGASDEVLRAAQDIAQGQPSRVSALVPERRRTRLALGAAAMVLLAFGISVSFLSLDTTPTDRGAHLTSAVGAPTRGTPLGAKGLSSGAPSSVNFTSSGASPSSSQTSGGTQGAGTALATKVVAVGTVKVTVPAGTVQSSVTSLSALVAHDDGYVASTQVHLGTDSSSRSAGIVVLRVPEAQFSTLVRQVQRYGTVTAVRTTSTDVTGEYVDLKARISALDEGRQQYLAIMARATSISDILAIQAQINNLQSQIEQYQGQLNVLDNQAAYGTLTVVLTPVGQLPLGSVHAASGVSTAWHDSVAGFVHGFEWLIRIAGPLLFVLLCLLALWFFGRLAWRASRRRML